MRLPVEVANKIPLSLDEFESRASYSNQFKGTAEAFNQLRFGFFGEIGGVLAAVKKSQRDLGPAEQANVAEELGDALWYLSTIAVECKHSLNEIGVAALADLQRRLEVAHARAAGILTFKEFDGLIEFCHSKFNAVDQATALCTLGAHCGGLMAKPNIEDLASTSKADLLGELLADIVLVCARYGLKLADIAEQNLNKAESRWPRANTEYLPYFDKEYSQLEQFPRQFTIRFIEFTGVDGIPYVIQQLNGVNIGDRLTDNRTEPDGYRFHDVFHLAYVAHLGWSPVLRSLLKLKRKSKPETDRDEDGARAIIIEEGIATWIFNHAFRHKYFTNTPPGKLEYGVLKQVREMVRGYEVYQCPLWQWERAILEGFKVFRSLCDERGGDVIVDMEKHTISFATVSAEKRPTIVAPQKKTVIGAIPPEMNKVET